MARRSPGADKQTSGCNTLFTSPVDMYPISWLTFVVTTGERRIPCSPPVLSEIAIKVDDLITDFCHSSLLHLKNKKCPASFNAIHGQGHS